MAHPTVLFEPRRRASHGKRVGILAGLGVAAAVCWSGREAFSGSRQGGRPARGSASCVGLNAYGDVVAERPIWNPIPNWKKKDTTHVPEEAQADREKQWYVLDASGKDLHELSRVVADLLMGINNPYWDGKHDVGAFVIVTNAQKVKVPGIEYWTRLYFRNVNGRPGGTCVERFSTIMRRFPERVVMKEVWDILQKNDESKRIFRDRLKLFAGPNHCFYEESPIEYPMHLVKDITMEDNLPYNMRLSTKMAGVVSGEDEAKRQAEQDIENYKRIVQFKEYLHAFYQEIGEEAASQIDMAAFIQAAENLACDKVLAANEGKPPKKRFIPMFPGTGGKIQWKPIFYA